METSLPIDLVSRDIPISGKWVVEDGKPMWQWTFQSGWVETLPALQVCMSSTTQSDRSMYIAEAAVKMQMVCQILELPTPTDEELARQIETQLLSWATSLSFNQWFINLQDDMYLIYISYPMVYFATWFCVFACVACVS